MVRPLLSRKGWMALSLELTRRAGRREMGPVGGHAAGPMNAPAMIPPIGATHAAGIWKVGMDVDLGFSALIPVRSVRSYMAASSHEAATALLVPSPFCDRCDDGHKAYAGEDLEESVDSGDRLYKSRKSFHRVMRSG